MNHTWDWAVFQYGQTETRAEDIAKEMGMLTRTLCTKMNRQGVKKKRAKPSGRNGCDGQYYAIRESADVAKLDAGLEARLRAGDPLVNADKPFLRCGECGAKTPSATCPNGHIINAYLAAAG